jgi:hypothetical protein
MSFKKLKYGSDQKELRAAGAIFVTMTIDSHVVAVSFMD